jgi:hypothetical protein
VHRWLWIASLASCGRFDFGSHDVDAPAIPLDSAPSSLIHDYPLATDYADTFGGPPLVDHGGSFATGAYQFGVNQGLSVAGVMPTDVYTIDFHFQLSTVNGYRKVIDFKALGSDAGLYVEDSMLQFVVIPVTGCPGSDCFTSPALIAPDTAVEVTLARDASRTITAYIDRALQFSFADGGSVGAFDGVDAVVNLFIDDTSTMSEASAGVVNNIRVYSTALSAADVAAQP